MRDPKSALIWITNILNELHVPYQIAGGLAARAYGATRELIDIDIDIPEECFDAVKNKVNQYITFGPTQNTEKPWDILLMTINYHGQDIDIGGAHHAKIYNQATGQWHHLATDFSQCVQLEIYGIKVPVISRDDLLAYKKILSRPVDIADIEEVENFIRL